MNLSQKLSSKNFFVFNLVLIGIIFGFSLALLSFSCTSPGSIARAQVAAAPTVVIPQEALAMAEALQTVFNAVAEKALPSVVEVRTISVQRRQQTQPFHGIPWDFFFGPRGERNDGPGQEREFRSRGLGSGIIVRLADGMYYVLTNSHVVDGTSEIIIATRDGREYPAEIRGNDRRRDLAILTFRSNMSYPLAELGNSDNVKVGDWAIAIGNPLGEQYAFSVTKGTVSAVGRTGGPAGNINDFIQTDAAINQGNSGGPLVNLRGEVIGINTWIASPTGGGNVGLGFAIPINNAKRTIDELIRAGTVSDGWLGVLLSDLNRDMMLALSLTDLRGSLIVQISLDSPADRGGIRTGDVVTHFDGREVRGTNMLIQMVSNSRPGDTVVFTVIRDGQSMNFTVRIEARSDTVAAENNRLWPGISVVVLSEELRNNLRLDSDAQGLYVINVIAGSPAASMGMQRGDRVTSINDIPVPDLASFYRVLRESTDRELWFGFIRGDNNMESIRFRR